MSGRKFTHSILHKLVLIAVVIVFLLLTASISLAADRGNQLVSSWWTGWFDRDDPTGTGDWETLADQGDVCGGQGGPIEIKAETVTGVPAENTGETFAFYNPQQGFGCNNADQTDGHCLDYEVRYRCVPPPVASLSCIRDLYLPFSYCTASASGGVPPYNTYWNGSPLAGFYQKNRCNTGNEIVTFQVQDSAGQWSNLASTHCGGLDD